MRWEIRTHLYAEKVVYIPPVVFIIQILWNECLDFQEWEATVYQKEREHILSIEQSQNLLTVVAVIPSVLI